MHTPPIISFIGWHNSGKTTIASKVVHQLTEMGYRVGVIKSTKEHGLTPDQPGTDTYKHTESGAARVALAAPDQVVIRMQNELDLPTLAMRCFSDMDLVIAEGFKRTEGVPKIVVHREGTEPLYEMVDDVVAVVTDKPIPKLPCFTGAQSKKISLFIVNQLHLPPRAHPNTSIESNKNSPLKE